MAEIAEAPTGSIMSFNPGQVAAMREQWVSAGYDPVLFDQAAGTTPNTPTQAPAAVQDAREGVEVMGAAKTPSWTRGQALEAAEALRAAGVPEDRIQAGLKESGFEPLAPDTRTEDEKDWDRAWPAPSPSDYNVNYRECWPDQQDVGTLAAANKDFTGWAAEMRLPPEIGTVMIERAIERGQAYSRMTDAQRQLWQREQRFDFERLAGGPDKVSEKVALAGKVLAMGSPDMLANLHRSGALHDAAIIIHLARHGERIQARERGLA